MKPYCVVYFNHASVYTVYAEKVFEGSWTACKSYLNKKDDDWYYGITNNFEGEVVNADYVQCYEV
jgi:hypothetical protein